jgi:hypothetical protein
LNAGTETAVPAAGCGVSGVTGPSVLQLLHETTISAADINIVALFLRVKSVILLIVN